MLFSVAQLQRWVDTLNPRNYVVTDEKEMKLREVDSDQVFTGDHLDASVISGGVNEPELKSIKDTAEFGRVFADTFLNNISSEKNEEEEERPVLDDKWFQEADVYQGDTVVEKGKPWVDPDDAPPLGKDFFDNAEIKDGDKIIRKGQRGHRPTDTTIDTQY